jgi:hypothetical protein
MKKYSFISLWVFLLRVVIFTSFAEAGLVTGPSRDIAGVGDFNGDGSQDILWRNKATGEVAVGYIHGSAPVAEQKLESARDPVLGVVRVGCPPKFPALSH